MSDEGRSMNRTRRSSLIAHGLNWLGRCLRDFALAGLAGGTAFGVLFGLPLAWITDAWEYAAALAGAGAVFGVAVDAVQRGADAFRAERQRFDPRPSPPTRTRLRRGLIAGLVMG